VDCDDGHDCDDHDCDGHGHDDGIHSNDSPCQSALNHLNENYSDERQEHDDDDDDRGHDDAFRHDQMQIYPLIHPKPIIHYSHTKNTIQSYQD
jgi:hypothetical protein